MSERLDFLRTPVALGYTTTPARFFVINLLYDLKTECFCSPGTGCHYDGYYYFFDFILSGIFCPREYDFPIPKPKRLFYFINYFVTRPTPTLYALHDLTSTKGLDILGVGKYFM